MKIIQHVMDQKMNSNTNLIHKYTLKINQCNKSNSKLVTMYLTLYATLKKIITHYMHPLYNFSLALQTDISCTSLCETWRYFMHVFFSTPRIRHVSANDTMKFLMQNKFGKDVWKLSHIIGTYLGWKTTSSKSKNYLFPYILFFWGGYDSSIFSTFRKIRFIPGWTCPPNIIGMNIYQTFPKKFSAWANLEVKKNSTPSPTPPHPNHMLFLYKFHYVQIGGANVPCSTTLQIQTWTIFNTELKSDRTAKGCNDDSYVNPIDSSRGSRFH